MSELGFEGRVAIVTGAGRGIGRAEALALASRGAQVVVNDLGGSVEGTGADTTPAAETMAAIEAAGGTAVVNGEDVATTKGAEAIVATALDTFGRVDVVVNNAGIIRHNGPLETDLDDLMRHLSVHVAGSYNVTRAAWPHMAGQGYGRVVMTTSSAIFGHETLISYGTAKAGVVGLMRGLVHAGKPHGINVNALAPNAFTRMSATSVDPTRDVGAYQALMDPAHVAELVAFLCHEECTASGGIYTAGGGRAARIFLAETAGHNQPGLTAEDVREHWEQINDESGYFVPEGTRDHSVKLFGHVEALKA